MDGPLAGALDFERCCKSSWHKNKRTLYPTPLPPLPRCRWLFPAAGVAAAQLQLQVAATVGIFVVSGLALQQGEALAAVRSWGALLYGVVAILLITPMLSHLLLRWDILWLDLGKV